MYKTDHVHPKWAQLAPLSTGTLPGLNAKYTRPIAESCGRSPVFLSQELRTSPISDIPIYLLISARTGLSALRSSWTQPSALAQGCAAFWLGFPSYCLCRHVAAPTGWYPIIVLFPTIIFWILMVQGKITEVYTPTVQLGAPLRTNQQATSIIPPFLRRMPFLLQRSKFILARDRHRNMLDCIPRGLGFYLTFNTFQLLDDNYRCT